MLHKDLVTVKKSSHSCLVYLDFGINCGLHFQRSSDCCGTSQDNVCIYADTVMTKVTCQEH